MPVRMAQAVLKDLIIDACLIGSNNHSILLLQNIGLSVLYVCSYHIHLLF
ncbi:MAG: hypothetical protein K0R82_556 [Flavipsychrobacter sp.]|nr:hypothetical protein [Flavipsychrobacter sp.]